MFGKNQNKIFHLASMARSGETLMLRILAAHPNIKVVHNLEAVDDPQKERSFQFLKSYKPTKIDINHPLFSHYQLKRKDVLLIKQGVWEHPAPFRGFVLARNPVSIYSSLKTYDKDEPGYDSESNFWLMTEYRLKRWARNIDPAMSEDLEGLSPIDQFCLFYSVRMNQLLATELPVVRYEDLILDTRGVIEKVCKVLGLEMFEALLSSHESYKPGTIGHGLHDLSKPISTASLDKYKDNVTDVEFDTIKSKCKAVYTSFNYSLENFKVQF